MENKSKKNFFFSLFQYVSESMCVAVFLLFFSEMLKKGLVTNTFHFNRLLTLVMIFGTMVIVFFNKKRNETRKPAKFLHLLSHSVLSLFVAVVMWWFVFQITGDELRIFIVVPWVAGLGVYGTVLLFLKEA